MLQRYLSYNIVDELLKDPSKIKFGDVATLAVRGIPLIG
jgi:hypothetical protein